MIFGGIGCLQPLPQLGDFKKWKMGVVACLINCPGRFHINQIDRYIILEPPIPVALKNQNRRWSIMWFYHLVEKSFEISFLVHGQVKVQAQPGFQAQPGIQQVQVHILSGCSTF